MATARDLTAAAPDARPIVLPGVGRDPARPHFERYATEIRHHVARARSQTLT